MGVEVINCEVGATAVEEYDYGKVHAKTRGNDGVGLAALEERGEGWGEVVGAAMAVVMG